MIIFIIILNLFFVILLFLIVFNYKYTLDKANSKVVVTLKARINQCIFLAMISFIFISVLFTGYPYDFSHMEIISLDEVDYLFYHNNVFNPDEGVFSGPLDDEWAYYFDHFWYRFIFLRGNLAEFLTYYRRLLDWIPTYMNSFLSSSDLEAFFNRFNSSYNLLMEGISEPVLNSILNGLRESLSNSIPTSLNENIVTNDLANRAIEQVINPSVYNNTWTIGLSLGFGLLIGFVFGVNYSIPIEVQPLIFIDIAIIAQNASNCS